ncbi:MAG: methionine--tRNA ligase [Candidatus Melainabacteria bacterium]|nr:methionine--tRNA ligase [Candidatus Melainabacteria bacterium]
MPNAHHHPDTPTTPRYITTAIDYVNAPPHLGHAYEKIATDAMARFYKRMGHPTFFLTGTDEHGIKVEKNALSKGLAPKAFVDELSQSFKQAWAHCGVAYDRFIRTTDEDHYALVAVLWNRLLAKGDIYKASYTGRYCQGCEAFLTDRDLTEDGLCITHQTAPEAVEEENYFFRLSNYKEAIIAHINANPTFIQPDFRKQEVLNMLENLEDISVSRSKQSVSWGIPVPNDETQVIYVWIDALSNYLTGIGYDGTETAQFNQFWKTPAGEPNAIHIIGKDILRFHAIYWPAMLMSAELPLPKQIFAHGFITLNEAKISKSLGNVISPFDLTAHYELANADPIRYYLLTCTQFGNDGNFTAEAFKLSVNADLANNLGNLLNRSVSMLKKYFGGAIPAVSADVLASSAILQELQAVTPLHEQVVTAYEAFNFQQVAEFVFARVDLANRTINDMEPWTLYKTEQLDLLAALMVSLLESLRLVAVWLSPMVPKLSVGIWSQLGLDAEAIANPSASFDALISGYRLVEGLMTNPQGPLLPRLDSELAGAEAKK